MPRPRLLGAPAAAVALALAAAPAAAQAPAPTAPAPPPAAAPAPAPAPGYAAETPRPGALYRNGPDGRHLLGGTWLFRLDPGGVGTSSRWMRTASTVGWSRTTVPNAWNADDPSLASFGGTVGWYRKDFRLPSRAAALAWVLRFESVNYRSRIWLNGRRLGANRGAYLPFELRIPARVLNRRGTNRLVVRVDNRRLPTDFPPSGLSTKGAPTGGWWNYGGLLREVYLRRADRVDLEAVQVRPNLACTTCPARIAVTATVRNLSSRRDRVSLTGRFGALRFRLGVRRLAPGRSVTLTRTLTVRRPTLWSPDRPRLTAADVVARSANGGAARWRTRTGVRSVRVSRGQLFLNGRRVNARGVGLHEDAPGRGFALDNRARDRQIAWTRELGAGLLRSHYPLHPYTHERADELGLLVWSEIPVYALKTPELAKPSVRRLAIDELRDNVLVNGDHPSVLVWSIANELNPKPGDTQAAYIREAARTAKRLDPSRPVGIAVAGYPTVGCRAAYGPLDVIGVNDYFGWYPGPDGSVGDRTLLGPYLDRVRGCYRSKAIFVSEFGAEANREGPAEEKGTYAFQRDWIGYHLGVFAQRPWLAGAVYWTLQEFLVRPGWEGGNPRPLAPLHQKALVTYAGERKPAFADVQRAFRGTAQLAGSR